MSNQQFYMVYNPKGSAPKVQHATYAAAKAEAQRLAAKQPNDPFYILRSRGAAVIAETPKPDVVALAAAVSRARDVEQTARTAHDTARDAFTAAGAIWRATVYALAEAQRRLLEAA